MGGPARATNLERTIGDRPVAQLLLSPGALSPSIATSLRERQVAGAQPGAARQSLPEQLLVKEGGGERSELFEKRLGA
jgi:hypothetical protein